VTVSVAARRGTHRGVTTGSKVRVLVSAGEPSGDAHAANVIAALRGKLLGCEVTGFGGERMAAVGADLQTRMESLSTIGFASVVRALPGHMRLWSKMRRDLRAGRYDLALLTDYPGFHMRVARAATEAGVPVLYYIAPQLWAWGERRISRLRRHVKHLAVILPFEQKYFQERGVPTTFVGHPLLDRVRPERVAARSVLGVSESRPVMGLFPGSRATEIRHMWPSMREAAALVRAAVPDLQVVVAAMPGFDYPGGEEFRLHRSDSATVMAVSDAALCKSGTTTLEAVLADTPLVICYRTDALSYAIARRVVRCRHVGLVNLVAGREVAPEYLQGSSTAAALARAVLPLLERDGEAARGQRQAFESVRSQLGSAGAADRVADLAVGLTSC
jgi:lipid-A-disaccharide synthase